MCNQSSMCSSHQDRNGGWLRIVHLLPMSLHVTVYGTFSFLLFPFLWIGSKIYGRPPILIYLSQVRRYLGYAWNDKLAPSDPPLESPIVLTRVLFTMVVIERYLFSVVRGAGWILDEILYGNQLDRVSVEKPFFLISAGRSGSTQSSRYLEEDPNLISPSVIMGAYPYLWAWRIAPFTIGQFVTKEKFQQKTKETASFEKQKRHDMEQFRTGTFDPSFFKNHLNFVGMVFGDTIAMIEGHAKPPPHNKELIEQDFVEFVDRIARKTLLFHGATTDKDKRIFIKGHFIAAAPALARKYPDCSMLAVLRDPLARLRSVINSSRTFPGHPALGQIPWPWLTRVFEDGEVKYCEAEQEWYSSKEDTSVKKCVVNFQEYVEDLPTVMSAIYKECFGMDHVPPQVPTKHTPKAGRGQYDINYSLEELGVDEEALKRRLAGYIEWMESAKRKSS